MSDLNSTILRYRSHRFAGRSVSQSAMLTGISKNDAEILESGDITPSPVHNLAGMTSQALVDRGLLSKEAAFSLSGQNHMVRGLSEPSGSAFHRAMSQALTDEDNANAWDITKGLLNGVKSHLFKTLGVVAETASIPQQLLYRAITDIATDEDVDYASAIPNWLRTAKSEKESPYEMLRGLDVLNNIEAIDPIVLSHEEFNKWKEETFSDEDNSIWDKVKLMSANTGYFVAGLGVDVALDPLTYVMGAGLAKKGIDVARRMLPAAVNAEIVGQIATKTKRLDDLLDYQSAVKKLHAKNIAEGDAWKIGKTEAVLRQIDDDLAVRGVGKGSDDLIMEGMPTARPEAIVPNKETMSPLRYKIMKQRQDAVKEGWPGGVNPNVLEDTEQALARITTYADDSEDAAHVLARMAAGADPGDIASRMEVLPINGTRTSTNIKMPHVGRDGLITQDFEYVQKFTKIAQREQDELLEAYEKAAGISGEKLRAARAELKASRKTFKIDDPGTYIDRSFEVNGIRFNQRGGLGATGYNAEVAYKGYTTFMTPKQFLKLNGKRAQPPHETITKAISGGEIAPPFLIIDDIGGGAARVTGHEGRGRAMALIDAGKGDVKIPVNIIPAGNMRARDLGKADVLGELLSDKMAEKAYKFKQTGAILERKTIGKTPKLRGYKTQEEIDGLAKAVDDLTAFEKETRKKVNKLSELVDDVRNGAIPDGDDLLKYDVQWPSGPRRELLDSADFIEDTFGNAAAKMFAKGLYPKSVVPRTGWIALNRLTNESWRVLDKYAPDISKRMFGAMQAHDTEMIANNERIRRIFEHAGITTTKSMGKKGRVAAELSGIEGAKQSVRLNRRLSEKAFKILDTDDAEVIAELLKGESKEFSQGMIALREFMNESGVRLGLGKDKRISGYISHIRRDHFKGNSIPYAYQGTSYRQKLPGFLRDRTKNGEATITDIVEVMDYYTRGLSQELHIKPMITDIRLSATKLAQGDEAMKSIPHFVEQVISRVEGRPSMVRQFLESALGSDSRLIGLADKAATAAAWSSYTSVLVGGPRYALMSMAQAINSTAPTYGVFNTLKASFKALTPEGRMITKKLGLTEEYKNIHDGIRMAAKGLEDAGALRMAGLSIKDAESYIRGISLHAGIGERMAKMGYKRLSDMPAELQRSMLWEATRDAKHLSHLFGWIGKPVWFSGLSRQGTSLLTQFTSFPFKQSATMWEAFQRNPGWIGDYLMISGWMTKVADTMGVDLEPHVGMPKFKDPTDRDSIVMEFMGAVIDYGATDLVTDDPMKKKEAWERLKMASKNMTPFATEFKRAKLRVGAAKGAFTGVKLQKRDTKGNLIRDYRTGLLPEGGGATDLISIMSSMDSVNDRIYRAKREKLNKAQSERMFRTQALAEELHDAVERGEAPNAAKMNRLRKELWGMGVRVTNRDLRKMYSKAQTSILVPYLIRQASRSPWNAHILGEVDTTERITER